MLEKGTCQHESSTHSVSTGVCRLTGSTSNSVCFPSGCCNPTDWERMPQQAWRTWADHWTSNRAHKAQSRIKQHCRQILLSHDLKLLIDQRLWETMARDAKTRKSACTVSGTEGIKRNHLAVPAPAHRQKDVFGLHTKHSPQNGCATRQGRERIRQFMFAAALRTKHK